MKLKGIDVSSYQGLPDWKKVSASGIQFAILRIHQQSGIDSSFEYNYKGCTANNIPKGVYKFSYAKTTKQAAAEADAVLAVLKGRRLEFPVFYDLEWSEQRSLGKSAITKIAKAFLNKIEASGYHVGIYCNVDWYNNVLDTASLPYDYWLAAYPYNDTGKVVESLRPKAGIGWQYSSKGSVPGISGNVDMDLFYKNYSPKEEQKVANGQAACDLALSRLKKNQYTQSSLRVQVFNGYSDCSSLVWKCFERAYGIYVGSWTGEQVSRGRQIIRRKTAVKYARLTQTDLDKMQIGDCIYYGAGSAVHVEIYLGNGQQIGHGSGIGPTIKQSLEYSHPAGVYQVRRFVADDVDLPDNSDWKAVGTATSTGDDVNVRNTPGGMIIGTVNKGNRFEIDGKIINGWYHVKVEDTVGYIYEDYVSEDKSDEAKPEDTRIFVGEVTADELNVRSWYGKDGNGEYYPQINSYPVLKKGNLVDVLASYQYDGDTWYKVRIADKYIGFVNGAYIK